ncbi:MAG: SGNH/GDSL hydrolase family protein [Alphaproteobacteria bacterium]
MDARPSARRRLLGWALYLAALALFLEFSARMLLRVTAVQVALGNHDDGYWQDRWIQRQSGPDSMVYGFDRYDPDFGWRTVPDLVRKPVFRGKWLTTNHEGDRDDHEWSESKPPGIETRILAIGDSFTFGEEVSNDETWASLLARDLPATEVLNAGVHGYGLDQILLRLRRALPRWHPDVVVLGFFFDDLTRNPLGFRDYAKPRFRLLPDGELELVGPPLPTPDEVKRVDWMRLRSVDFARRIVGLFRKADRGRETHRLGAAILERIARESPEAGANPVFVYLPSRRDFGPKPGWGERWMFDQCRRIPGVRCVSTRAALTALRDSGKAPFRVGHYSEAGNAVVAGELAGFLRREGLAGR